MTAFNVVRFRVKPGNEQRFIDVHRKVRPKLKGFLRGSLVQTGDHTFCMIGEWRSFQSIVAARPEMISILDQLRDMLEDLGGDLGVTDPVSGPAVVKLTPSSPVRKRASPAKSPRKRLAKRRVRRAAE